MNAVPTCVASAKILTAVCLYDQVCTAIEFVTSRLTAIKMLACVYVAYQLYC